MSTEPYVPDEDDIIRGDYRLEDNLWRHLTEAEVRRGIAKVKADALREAQSLLAADGYHCPALDDRIEKEVRGCRRAGTPFSPEKAPTSSPTLGSSMTRSEDD